MANIFIINFTFYWLGFGWWLMPPNINKFVRWGGSVSPPSLNGLQCIEDYKKNIILVWFLLLLLYKTRMTTFIKTKFKISDLESPKILSQRKIIIQIGPETTKFDFCGPDSHLGKVQYRILNPHQISKSKKKNIQIGPETTKLCFY